MKTIKWMLAAIAVTVLSTNSSAQFYHVDSVCACKVFPYWYCAEGSSSWYVFCADDPTEYPPNANTSVLGPLIAIKAPGIFECIRRDNQMYPAGVNAGNQAGYGYVWNWELNKWIPGVNVDNFYYPQGGTWSLGAYMDQMSGAGSFSPLQQAWATDIGFALGDCAPIDSTCCINIVFQTDSNFYLLRGLDPASGSLGLVNPQFDPSCTRTCGDHTININATNQFFYGTDSIDYSDPPTQLKQTYAVGGNGGIPPHKLNVGTFFDWTQGIDGWDQLDGNVYSEKTYDFVSVIMHEMGHWIGLPDRTTPGDNTGKPCGNPDPNSIMNGSLAPGQMRSSVERFSDDACWIRKLYCPDRVPKCAATHSGVLDQTLWNIALEQSHPNPTTGEAVIGFTIDHDAYATIEIFDILGRKVMTPIQQTRVVAGHHDITVPAELPSGKYIYTLHAGGAVLSKEMTIVR
jgi:hypothetical protein